MASQDAITLALSAPMDWGAFEALAHEVLLQDDFPRLRRLGGGSDKGLDAIDEVFYLGSRGNTQAVIQVTSQRAQVAG